MMENSWNPGREYFNRRMGFGKIPVFVLNCSFATKGIWEVKMGRDVSVWKKGNIFFLICFCGVVQQRIQLYYFSKYVFLWIMKCWNSWDSKKGMLFISSVLRYYLSKNLSPNTQICVYLHLSCLPLYNSLYFSVFTPCKSVTKLVVFISHSCLFFFSLSSK